ncbi:ABC transporter G family member 25-like [Miscanthus floridulus]|uniref:ABC transporter G family member 25-like n=1 Tax=Miscanthus floridulus TaxID=154761 RepID=UPI003457497A
MWDARAPQLRRRGQGVVISLLLLPLLLLLLLAGAASGQQQVQPPPLPPVPPADLPDVERQLNNLTDNVAATISDKFSFCVADAKEDWNEAFNYTSDLSFVDRCLTETRGDLPQRLCTPDEVKFYFSSLYDRDGDKNINLKTNINCNISYWEKGCDAGWACATNPVQDPRNRGSNGIPLRTSNCQACCEGFFCPRGLTCMLPCPLGSYCPRATANQTTGLCDPYKYQITPNTTNSCGGADMWADIQSTEEIFCPAGFHCPSTTKKDNCSSGHYCRLGSTAEEKCIIKGSCDENTENENIKILGACIVGALCLLLLIIYNFSDKFLSIRERRKARSRENAIQLARQQLKAQERWKAAKQFARRHVNDMQGHLSRTFSRRRSFRQKVVPEKSSHRVQEAPLMSQVQMQEMSDSAVFASQSTNEITEVMPSVIVDVSDDGEVVATKEKPVPKGKHRSTHTQVFKYAYGEIEKEKFQQQENKNLTFTGVIAMVKDQQKEITRPLLKVEFRDLTLMLGKKKLLRSINGELRPGRVTAVMGPSGAGKTTFLNAVTGKVSGYKMTGSVLVNGKNVNIRSYKKIIGFVPQDDIVHGNLTVEENLWFSAKCRLSASMKHRDKVLIVERVIDSLDLQGIRNSLVGTVEKRGISGGQRKRVNVGIEMVMEPSLLILDEPTSGLDSSSSQLLLRALRHEALEGVNVCAVVHQPSYTLYNMFDDLILLAKGGLMVYNGPVKMVEEYFTTLGIHVPDRVNPPDHYIDILEGIVKPESGIKAKHLPAHWMLHNGYEVPSDMQDDVKEIGEQTPQFRSSSSLSGSTPHCLPIRNAFAEECDRLEQHLSKPKDLSSRKTPGIFMQYKYYLGRVTKQRLREARLLMVDFLILGLAGICLGTIAKLSDKTFGMPGYIYTIIAVSLLCKIAALRSFSLERLQYFRERESGMSSLAYFLARDTIDHFSTVVKPIIYLSMFYYFNNPRSTIGDNYVVLFALVYCVTGIGYTFAICFSPGSAQLCSALIPVVLTLLSTQRSTPTFLKRLCYSKWALEGFIIVNAKKYPGVWLITRCGLLFQSQFDIHNYKLCILVLFMYGLFFRMVAFAAMILLKKR